MTTIRYDEAYKMVSDELSRVMSRLSALGDNGDNISYDDESMDEDLIQSELKNALEELENVKYRIEYLNKPVTEHGALYKGEDGKYQIKEDGVKLSSGSTCEILYRQDAYNEPYWLITSVEFDHATGDYYPTELGREYPLEGAYVRIR